MNPPPSYLSLPTPTPSLTVQALADGYLTWLHRHRAASHWREAKRHLGRWCEAHGGFPAQAITGAHLEAFQETLQAQGHAPLYVKKHATSVRACYNRGVKLGLLPKGFKPFADIEGIRLEPKPLLESDLPMPEEIKALFAHAKPDFRAMLMVYYNTGARTHELIEARCGDFQPKARTLILGKHKRSRTLREYQPRTITLNAEAEAIIRGRCEGPEPGALLWPNRNGKAFTSVLLGDMFARLRKRSKVRENITIYSFRHLWISEMLMAGFDSLIVAKMA